MGILHQYTYELRFKRAVTKAFFNVQLQVDLRTMIMKTKITLVFMVSLVLVSNAKYIVSNNQVDFEFDPKMKSGNVFNTSP